MKRKIFSLLFLAGSLNQLHAQVISCPVAEDAILTSYTNGSPNDSIFFLCPGQQGTLTATPSGGVPLWNFIWQIFVPGSNSWNVLTSQNGLTVSTITNLQPGGYRVVITDGNGQIVDTDIAWINRLNTPPSVSVDPISPGCNAVHLSGNVTLPSTGSYYNPPAAVNPTNSIMVGPDTQINVCFSAVHSYVSDLGFYLVGPPSCGSPTVILSPNPGAIGQGPVCNSGDNVSNLCFSTNSFNNLDVCNAFVPLSGTYGSYGSSYNSINWSPIYGCDASQPGWAVQIYDCIGLDVGALTMASLSFTGTTVGGTSGQVTYNSGNIYSAINDNSCSPNTASIYVVTGVTPPPAVPINLFSGYTWTANPPFPIPGANSSLDINLTPGPSVDTQFTLSITGPASGVLCGGNNSASVLYDYTSPIMPAIDPVEDGYCITHEPFQLLAYPPGGTWSGVGIADPNAGIYSPALAGEGDHTIIYSYQDGECQLAASAVIHVESPPDIIIDTPDVLCVDSAPIQMISSISGGVWTGTGISDPDAGIFDPAQSGAGSHPVTQIYNDICYASGQVVVQVVPTPVILLTDPGDFCLGDSPVNLQAAPSGGVWSGPGVNGILFDPNMAGEGIHGLTYTMNDVCLITGSVAVTVSPVPVVSAGSDVELCAGSSAQLNATGASQWLWIPSDGLDDESISSPVATPIETTTYTVIGTSTAGCVDEDEITITVNSLPVVTTFTPDPFDLGDSVQLDAFGLASYTWSPAGGLSDPGIPNPYASPSQTTLYTVSGLDANGCPGSAEVLVTVIMPNSSLIVPNIITPNGDAENQVFRVSQVAIVSLTIDIFNRWGAHVGSIDSPDGFWSADDSAETIYYYILKARGMEGKEYDMEGNFHVLRD